VFGIDPNITQAATTVTGSSVARHTAKMVHLSAIPNDDGNLGQTINKIKQTHLSLAPDEADSYTSSVYGSKFAIEDLPKHEMPENEMPKGNISSMNMSLT
jgi:hypothetical protein